MLINSAGRFTGTNTTGREETNAHETTRHVIVLALSALGEFLLMLPLLDEIRRLYPQAKLTLICERPVVTDWAKQLHVADQVISLPCHVRRAPYALLCALCLLGNIPADLALQPFTSHGSFGNLLIGQIRAPVRCGYADGRLQRCLTHRLPIRHDQHHITMNLNLLRRLGHRDVREPGERFLPMWQDLDCDHKAELRVYPYGRYAVISVGSDAKLAFKRWEDSKWARLCVRLSDLDITCVFTGTKADQDTIEGIIHRAGGRGVNLAGQTSLEALITLVRSSEIVIGTDGMTLHLAAATHRPCIGIFGPTDPLHVGPWGQTHRVVRLALPCMPCYGPSTVGKPITCRTQECLRHLPVELVFQAVRDALREQEFAFG